jgi:hypothetical protein
MAGVDDDDDLDAAFEQGEIGAKLGIGVVGVVGADEAVQSGSSAVPGLVVDHQVPRLASRGEALERRANGRLGRVGVRQVRDVPGGPPQHRIAEQHRVLGEDRVVDAAGQRRIDVAGGVVVDADDERPADLGPCHFRRESKKQDDRGHKQKPQRM